MRTLQPGTDLILIVEDDVFIAELLEFLLTREKYRVHIAPDGNAARAFMESQPPPALVLLDVMLPYIDGLDLLRLLRAKPGWETVRIVMLTAKAEGHDIARGLDWGADDYLLKPFKPEELYARLRRLLNKR